MRWLAIFTMTALLAGSTLAQPPGGGRGFGGGMFGGGGGAALLAIKEVQAELKLTDEQKEKVTKLGESMREKMQELGPKMQEIFQSGNGPGYPETMKKVQELTKPIRDEVQKEIKDTLKPEQVTRLKQLELQQAGVMSLTRDEDAAKKLNVTDEQKKKLQTIQTDMMADMRELMQGGGFGDPETQKKMQTLRKETTEKATAVLTDEQKKTWKDMTGEQFKFPEPQWRARPPV